MRLNHEEGVKRWEQEKTVRGGVGGENEGTLKVFLTKAPSSIPDSCITYDWFILTALVN